MKKKRVTLKLVVVFLSAIFFVPVALAWTPAPDLRERMEIDDIWEEGLTHNKREETARKLLHIALDTTQNPFLREHAIRKLTEEKIFAVFGDMKTLAQAIELSDDKLPNLKRRALLAYHVLRHYRESDSATRKNLLLESLQTNSWEWAADELLFFKQEDALPLIKQRIHYRLSGERAQAKIVVVDIKFKMMIAPNRAELLTLALNEEYPFPEDFPQKEILNQKGLLRGWAIKTLERLGEDVESLEKEKYALLREEVKARQNAFIKSIRSETNKANSVSHKDN